MVDTWKMQKNNEDLSRHKDWVNGEVLIKKSGLFSPLVRNDADKDKLGCKGSK